MNLSQLFLFFIAYSVIGWISEVVYCSVQERRLVNRGFLHGPLCPVYGFGALLVVFLLEPFSGSVLVLFLAGMALTTALEYITAWLLETAFSTRWWDYSDLPFNFRGRVCLLNSVLFGLMSLIGVRVLHPFLESFLFAFPVSFADSVAVVLAALLFVDLAYTLRNLVNFEEKLVALGALLETVVDGRALADRFGEKDLREILADLRARVERENTEMNRRLAARLEGLLDRTRGMRRLLHAFPSVRNALHGPELRLFRLFHGSLRRDGQPAGRTWFAHLVAVVAVAAAVILLGAFVFGQQ